MTNREWLMEQMQNISDEELGDFLGCMKCEMCAGGNSFTCDSNCGEGIGRWLKSEHKEPIKLSDVERVILENMDGNYQYICRDKNGQLMVYLKKPRKDNTIWNDELGYDYKRLTLFEHLFQFIKWEDTEPYNIEELLK